MVDLVIWLENHPSTRSKLGWFFYALKHYPINVNANVGNAGMNKTKGMQENRQSRKSLPFSHGNDTINLYRRKQGSVIAYEFLLGKITKDHYIYLGWRTVCNEWFACYLRNQSSFCQYHLAW